MKADLKTRIVKCIVKCDGCGMHLQIPEGSNPMEFSHWCQGCSRIGRLIEHFVEPLVERLETALLLIAENLK